MRITRVAAESLRSFEHLGFDPHPHLNVIRGANAAGKTTVLEAVYLGARAGSFRARRLDEVVRERQAATKVSLGIRSDFGDAPPTHWSVTCKRGEAEVSRLDQTATRRELAEAIPVALVDRQLHRVFEEGPVYRRRFLDWGLFYVEHSFFGLWRRYERALRQRNQALRQKLPVRQIQVWDQELVVSGEALQSLRQGHLQQLQAEAGRWLELLLEMDRFRLQLVAGWDETKGLQSALDAGLEGDRRMGYTYAGPHRAELRLRFEGREARSHVSRGQQKMLAAAMVLSQASLVGRHRQEQPVVLLDDLEAELSRDWQLRLLAALRDYPGQSLVTSLEWRVAPDVPGFGRGDYRLFHVEQGTLGVVETP